MHFPIGAAVKMGHGCQHIKRIASSGGHVQVGGCGAVQIQTKIIGQVVLVEDVFQQSLVSWAQQHHVVGHIVESFVGAKVPNKQTHGISATFNLGVGPYLSVLRLNKVFVGPCGVGIGDHHLGMNAFTCHKRHPTGLAILDIDALNLRVGPDTPAHVLNQTYHAADQSARTTHGPVHTVASLKCIDE